MLFRDPPGWAFKDALSRERVTFPRVYRQFLKHRWFIISGRTTEQDTETIIGLHSSRQCDCCLETHASLRICSGFSLSNVHTVGGGKGPGYDAIEEGVVNGFFYFTHNLTLPVTKGKDPTGSWTRGGLLSLFVLATVHF